MPTRYRIVFSCVLVLLATGVPLKSGYTQHGVKIASGHNFEQIALTRQNVERFAESWSKFLKIADKCTFDIQTLTENSDPMAGITACLTGQPERNAMVQMLRRYGFSDIASWLTVCRTVMITYGFVRAGIPPKQIEVKLQAMLRKLRENKNLTPAQRMHLIQGLDATLGRFTRIQPLPGNVKLVKSMEQYLKMTFQPGQ